jgi:hypothetical protein
MQPKPDSFLTAESPFVIGFKILPDIRPANAYPYKDLTALRIREQKQMIVDGAERECR